MNRSSLSHYFDSTVMVVVLYLLSVSTAYAKTIYVDSIAAGANNGTSWSDAYIDLQPAIDAADHGDEVWVAAGIYHPTSWPNGGSDDRERHFSLKNGVAVYGGFSGMETYLDERDAELNETILSADIGIEGDDSDNCYHVFYHPEGTDLDTSAVLDGFTITGGNADDFDHEHDGGGMYNHSSSPTLANCSFNDNSADKYGGSMYNGSSSSPELINCTFKDNSAYYGGGMYNYSSSSPTLTNCTFNDNSARVVGGGIYNDLSSPNLVNCIFIENWAYGGGGMKNSSSSPTLTNCTFSSNLAKLWGGGMENSNSSPTLINCILWNNDAIKSGNEVYNGSGSSTPTFFNCDIKDSFAEGSWDEELGTDGGNNIDSDPFFVREPRTNGYYDPGDLHLTPGSPCIDAGDPSITNGQDMDGEARVFDGDWDGTAIVDIGADEFVGEFVDPDYDGIMSYYDNCPNIYNPMQEDRDGDGCGDACDGRPDNPTWITITGSITSYETPLCAMVLANGQHMFTCGSTLGFYELDVPLDKNGKITLYGFCSELAPFKAVLTPEEALVFDIEMFPAEEGSQEIEITIQIEPSSRNTNWRRIHGSVTYYGEGLCAMVLANGKRMFSCGDNLGTFDMDVPLDEDGEITLYVFSFGFAPYKEILVVP